LPLVAGTVSVEGNNTVILASVLVCERNASTNGYLSAHDTVATVEVLRKHVHRSTLSVGNSLSSSQQFTNDGLDGCSTHQSEAVASVGGDDAVFLGDSVLDAYSDSFLTGGEMAETADLLFLVKSVGGHFHTSVLISVTDGDARALWQRT
jgi:hypothetical protein